MAEESPRSGVDAVGSAAEIDPVEIKLEDLVLRELAFNGERQDRFLDLAAERAAVGQENITRELLSDGRPALRPAAGVDAHFRGARDADGVDAQVRAEALVLNG